MTVSPAEETVAIATANNQLLTFSLSPTDLLKAGEEGNVEHALTSFHTGQGPQATKRSALKSSFFFLK